MKVRATDKFTNVLDATTGDFRHPGEEWECSDERAKYLEELGYVVVVEEMAEVEEVTPKKRGRKKN